MRDPAVKQWYAGTPESRQAGRASTRQIRVRVRVTLIGVPIIRTESDVTRTESDVTRTKS